MSDEPMDSETRPATPTPLRPLKTSREAIEFEELTMKLARVFRYNPTDRIVLHNPPLHFKDLNGFILKWVSGSFPDLEVFTATFSKDIQTSSVNLYQDLELFAWNPLKRPEFHGNVRCSVGVADVERADGTRATIIVSMRKFQFLVWKGKFLQGM